MSKPRITAYARATLTVEVTGLGSWGPECSVDQIFRQASESAIGRIVNCRELRNVRIIGRPKITSVHTEET